MSMDLEPEVGGAESTEVVQKQEAPQFETLEAALAELDRQKAIAKDVIADRDKMKRTLREQTKSKEAEEQATLTEQAKFKELYEQTQAKLTAMEQKQRDRALSSSLKAELEKAGVKAVDTASKLIDKASIEFDEDGELVADSIAAVVKALQASDPFLFDQQEAVKVPGVKRATEGTPVGGYETELAAAKTAKELATVMKKYGMNATGYH